MIRPRTTPSGFIAEPATSLEIEDTATALRARRHCLRVVFGGAHGGFPDPVAQRGPAADRDLAAEMVDSALAGRLALVVDDEPMILEILAEYCALLRMEVCEAADGEGALRQIETRPGIEVLITDVRMPGLDGPALAEQALVISPGMKVIFVTGYATHRSFTWPILRKPFDLNELEEALRQALVPKGSVPE
jgi:CheY-like chemotaxis protein